MKDPEKQHETGLRILEILKVLLESDVKKSELLEKLKELSLAEHVYTQEVISKYFNTLSLLGLRFKKDKSIYGLENALLKVDFNRQEGKILRKLIKDVSKLNNKKEEEIMRKIIYRFDKFTTYNLSSIQDGVIENQKYLHNLNVKENVIITLKNMIYDKQNVVITYIKNNGEEETLTVELKEIIEQKKRVYIVCYDSKIGRNKKLSIESVVSIKQLPQKAPTISLLNTVVFEISGRLASVYKLKPSEKVIDFSNNHITVSNAAEDKDVLIRRLLKYGENCKILRPKSVQDDFISLTESILKNLEAC